MHLQTIPLKTLTPTQRIDLYTAILIPAGASSCTIDSGTYPIVGPSLIFVTPFQTLDLASSKGGDAQQLQFHGDFYCIEFHKPEVACNGLLFNNVYLSPVLRLSKRDLVYVQALFKKLEHELHLKEQDRSVLISYLQLFLAVASRIKRAQLDEGPMIAAKDEHMERFRGLVDQHFLTKHSPSDYAQLLGWSAGALTKRCKAYFAKTPSQLIHERLVLEARKKLHLTRDSVKEVAFALHFQDEHYFSRFFKKAVGLSPQAFRKKAGISVVADLST